MNIVIAQLSVTKEIGSNLHKILSVLEQASPGDWVIFPEGMISGYYPEDQEYIKNMDSLAILDSIKQIKQLIVKKNISCLVGTALAKDNVWHNSTIYLSPDQEITYNKNNLSTLDRNHFTQGNLLQIYEQSGIKFGIQMCRELVFPEQWKLLKKMGAQIVFHINNSIKESDKVREALIIARAFENQFWVCSVNNAALPQAMRSMLVSPTGEIIWESTPQVDEVKLLTIDLSLVNNTYLQQERSDLVE